MTRLAIVSDIHGNLPALDAVRRDIEREQVDAIVVAGDSVNWGPQSAEVVDVIAREGWAVIRGNNECYLLDYATPRAPSGWSSPDYRPLQLLREQLAGARHARVAAWPDTLSLRFPDAPALRVVHGSPRNHWDSLHVDTPDERVAEALGQVEEGWVVAGHTHLAMERRSGRWTIFNPGSVGIPLDGTFDAQFLLLDGDEGGWRGDWRRVSYDRAQLFDAFARSGLVERCGVVGELIVEEFRTARIQLHAFVRWRDERHPGEPLSRALLAEFRQLDRWAYTEPAYHLNRAAKPASPDRRESPDG